VLGDEENSFERNYPILFTNQAGHQLPIGSLKITATLSEIYRQLIDKTVVILLTQGLKTLFMSICILLLVERIVIRHLNAIANWANKVDLANPEQALTLPKRHAGKGDAIDKVQMAINGMQSNLIDALTQREQTERLTDSIINNSPSLIHAKDNDGRYIMANQKYLSVLELPEEQVIGHTANELFPEEIADKLLQHDSVISTIRKPVIFDEQLTIEQDSSIYVSAKFPIFDDSGRIVGTGGVSTDITDRRRKEQQIVELNETLEKKVLQRTEELQASLNNLKYTQEQLVESEKMSALGNLVAGVAHEINTPLGVSVTATSYLEESVIEFEQQLQDKSLSLDSVTAFVTTSQESISILQANLNRAVALIRNFKQVAVDQSSEAMREFDLCTYLNEVVHSLKPQMKKAGHQIQIECSEPITIHSYPGALAQVLTNLVMNSVIHGFKDCTEGKIAIKASRIGDMVTLDYHDNGRGLTSEQREKVFEPFYTTARGASGSGLGMSISYNLVVNRLGGHIRCLDSERGAHFMFTFPIKV
jgi:PAS domain S-box-containing protein